MNQYQASGSPHPRTPGRKRKQHMGNYTWTTSVTMGLRRSKMATNGESMVNSNGFMMDNYGLVSQPQIRMVKQWWTAAWKSTNINSK